GAWRRTPAWISPSARTSGCAWTPAGSTSRPTSRSMGAGPAASTWIRWAMAPRSSGRSEPASGKMARFMAGGVQSAAMNRRPFLLFPAAAVALVLALAVPAAQAWSRHGHQLVGELAERQLSPAVLAEVRTLLADEPEPGLAAIAPWADEIRASGNAPGERSKRWHFVNIPGQDCHYLPERDCPDGNCIIGAIQAQQALLADRSQPRQARAEALKFLVHFLGDVHQPMHAGYPHDRGGNGYQIQYRGEGAPEGEGTNLHGVWDYWLLRSAGLDLP